MTKAKGHMIAFTRPAVRMVSAPLRSHSICDGEVIPLLYSQNSFALQQIQHLVRWIETMRTHNAALIVSFELTAYPSRKNGILRRFFKIIPQLSGVPSLAFEKLGPPVNREAHGFEDIWFARAVVKRMPWLTRLYDARDRESTTVIRFAAEDDDVPYESRLQVYVLSLMEEIEE